LDLMSSRELSPEVEAIARAFAQWDANSLVLRYAAYRAHDIAAPFEGDVGVALARVSAPTLVIASATDRLIGTEGARRISEKIRRASYAEIASDLGHRALRAGPATSAGEFINEQILGFLAKPSEGSR